MQTETAIKTVAYNEYEEDAYVFRDEVMIEHDDSNDVISYLIEDGATVSKGEVLGTIYENEKDAKNQLQIEKLQKELTSLEELQSGNSSLQINLESLDEQVYECVADLTSANAGNTYVKKEDQRAKLLDMLNKRKLIIGKKVDFSSKINEINVEINKLKNDHISVKGTLESPDSGYFISGTNGYENIYDYNKVLEISPSEIANGFKKQSNPEGVIGKIDKNVVWYVVCNMNTEDLIGFTVGDYVDISMPYVLSENFSGKIVAINNDTTGTLNSAAVVFACNRMNSVLSRVSHEKIKIRTSEKTGIRISKNAIHVNTLTRDIKDENGNTISEKKDVQGVYVLYGKQLIFKQIVPLCANDKYVLCDSNPDDEKLFTKGTVQVYDKVVVKGTDLYDGKFA